MSACLACSRVAPLAGRRVRERHGATRHSTRLLSRQSDYVLSDPLDNFIVGHKLIGQIADGSSGKAETSRLGHENSEDALTWNVFRSLQEAGLLHLLAPLLCECNEPVEPELYVWGSGITNDAFEP